MKHGIQQHVVPGGVAWRNFALGGMALALVVGCDVSDDLANSEVLTTDGGVAKHVDVKSVFFKCKLRNGQVLETVPSQSASDCRGLVAECPPGYEIYDAKAVCNLRHAYLDYGALSDTPRGIQRVAEWSDGECQLYTDPVSADWSRGIPYGSRRVTEEVSGKVRVRFGCDDRRPFEKCVIKGSLQCVPR